MVSLFKLYLFIYGLCNYVVMSENIQGGANSLTFEVQQHKVLSKTFSFTLTIVGSFVRRQIQAMRKN
jgi:hypothetical protein